MNEGDLLHAIQAMQVLVEGSVASSAGVLDSSDAHLEMPRMRFLRDIIDRNLGSWNLHPGRLCKLANISRSNLYRMFEPYGGVVRYIQRERLRRAHAVLADPTSTQKISLIASDYCFSDSSAFSRAFRQEYGYSPMDLRRHPESTGATIHSSRPPQRIRAGGGWDFLFASDSRGGRGQLSQ
jgi:AraC-like DNA-binding protein